MASVSRFEAHPGTRLVFATAIAGISLTILWYGLALDGLLSLIERSLGTSAMGTELVLPLGVALQAIGGLGLAAGLMLNRWWSRLAFGSWIAALGVACAGLFTGAGEVAGVWPLLVFLATVVTGTGYILLRRPHAAV